MSRTGVTTAIPIKRGLKAHMINRDGEEPAIPIKRGLKGYVAKSYNCYPD